ncbi:hypothetical protein K2Q16_02330 [Patescibacteria group bacterium]|nr:hypothetical protein [Patescibacteria group bacterium]
MVQGHRSDLVDNAVYITQIISNLRDTGASELPEADRGHIVSFALVVKDKRDQAIAAEVKDYRIPETTEEFLSELESFIEEARNPAPSTEQPALAILTNDLDALTDPDDVMGALALLRNEVAEGRMSTDDFMPTWEYLRDRASLLLSNNITAAASTSSLEHLSEEISFFQAQGLLDGLATKTLQDVIEAQTRHLTNQN